MSDGFTKYDESKRRYDLIPYDALEEIIKALEFGAHKYDDYNWLKCPSRITYWRPLMRHATAWIRGVDVDPESGLSHLAHCGANLLILITLELRGLGQDDRVKPSPNGSDCSANG
jgi:hypothetical protein